MTAAGRSERPLNDAALVSRRGAPRGSSTTQLQGWWMWPETTAS